MNQKNVFIIILVIILFITGCTQVVKEKTPETKEPIVSRADQKIISDLMKKLNSKVMNYQASYKKEHEFHSWAGHSGATDYTEESNISIEVSNGQIINYTIRHINEGWPIEKEDYYKYYQQRTGELCQQNIVSNSGCTYSEEPIAPTMGGYVEGCRVKSDGGRHLCRCNGNEKSIAISENIEPKMPCKEPIQTVGFKLWDEFNIIYYPETAQSLCYFVTKPEDNSFAFECQNKNIKLIPNIKTNKPLKNVVCRYSKYNYFCDCSFNPIRITTCNKEIPDNFDATVKKDILNYLKNVHIATISEENNENGYCYSLSYNQLKHNFCFDGQNLITFAQWGKDIKEDRSTSVDINKIEKI